MGFVREVTAPPIGFWINIMKTHYLFSPCHRTWNCGGTIYYFTACQAMVVEALYLAWQSGTCDVSQSHVLFELGLKSSQFKDIFKAGSKGGHRRMHDAWGTFIVQGRTKGTARLNIPDGGTAQCSFEFRPPTPPRNSPARVLVE